MNADSHDPRTASPSAGFGRERCPLGWQAASVSLWALTGTAALTLDRTLEGVAGICAPGMSLELSLLAYAFGWDRPWPALSLPGAAQPVTPAIPASFNARFHRWVARFGLACALVEIAIAVLAVAIAPARSWAVVRPIDLLCWLAMPMGLYAGWQLARRPRPPGRGPSADRSPR